MHETIMRLSSAEVAASRQRWTAQLPKLHEWSVDIVSQKVMNQPMGHHLEATIADGLDDFASFFSVGDLELLLEEDGCLLVGGANDTSDEDMVGWIRSRMQ